MSKAEKFFKDPLAVFEKWFDEAKSTSVKRPECFTLTTCTSDGKPSSRAMLLKGHDHRGFEFFTNFHSRKAKDLDENPQACILFYWDGLEKQIEIEGVVERLSDAENDEYWQTRPAHAQIGALASEQSSPIMTIRHVEEEEDPLSDGRDELERRFKDIESKYRGQAIPRPSSWGGYILRPTCIEFWERRNRRLHDRIQYSRKSPDSNEWVVQKLYP
eukprot:gb/GECH01011393.1/.p1 GENE.gb/GECH01011393.1/~~gb/GECH01011393.1/.p1  ORF type:complete len:216 (+),score=48.59 gb/GECH01011393.1/:1-648(+)